MSEIEFVDISKITEEEKLIIDLIKSLKETSNAFQMLNKSRLEKANLPKIFTSASLTMLAYTLANTYSVLKNKEDFKEIANEIRNSIERVIDDMPALSKRLSEPEYE